MAEALAWHNSTICPYGGEAGSCKGLERWQVGGCEGYSFPGINPAPDYHLK